MANNHRVLKYPFLTSISALIFVSTLFVSSTSANEIEVPEASIIYEHILKCAAGTMSDEIEGRLEGAVNRWRDGLVEGKFKRDTNAPFVLSFQDEKLRLEAYQLYLSCLDGKEIGVIDQDQINLACIPKNSVEIKQHYYVEGDRKDYSEFNSTLKEKSRRVENSLTDITLERSRFTGNVYVGFDENIYQKTRSGNFKRRASKELSDLKRMLREYRSYDFPKHFHRIWELEDKSASWASGNKIEKMTPVQALIVTGISAGGETGKFFLTENIVSGERLFIMFDLVTHDCSRYL